MRQVFIARKKVTSPTLERKLYIIRKSAAMRSSAQARARKEFYVRRCRAHRVLQGHALAHQVGEYYKDLQDAPWNRARVGPPALLDEYIPVVGSGASIPPDLPQREINTLRGNVNWIRARQGHLEPVLGRDLDKIWPLIYDGSRLGFVDNALELLVMAVLGRARDDDDDPGAGRTTR